MYGRKLVNICHGSNASTLDTAYTTEERSIVNPLRYETHTRTSVSYDDTEEHDRVCTVAVVGGLDRAHDSSVEHVDHERGEGHSANHVLPSRPVNGVSKLWCSTVVEMCIRFGFVAHGEQEASNNQASHDELSTK